MADAKADNKKTAKKTTPKKKAALKSKSVKKTTANAQKKPPLKKKVAAKKATKSPKGAPKKAPINEETLNTREGEFEMTSKSKSNSQPINLADKIWRLMAMIAFAFIGYFALLLLIVLSAMQFVVVMLNDEINLEIKTFMERIGTFISQVFSFLSYNSEEMPFPFAPFPDEKIK